VDEQQLYPREEEPWWRRYPNPNRRWGVNYNLTYDGTSAEWTWYYRTKLSAHIFAWWHVYISSWGGSAVLFDNRKNRG
jgi:hypothetical protein